MVTAKGVDVFGAIWFGVIDRTTPAPEVETSSALPRYSIVPPVVAESSRLPEYHPAPSAEIMVKVNPLCHELAKPPTLSFRTSSPTIRQLFTYAGSTNWRFKLVPFNSASFGWSPIPTRLPEVGNEAYPREIR